MRGAHDMRFSRGAALIIGILPPTLETVRRWNTWRLDPPALFDDYLIGSLLLGESGFTGRIAPEDEYCWRLAGASRVQWHM